MSKDSIPTPPQYRDITQETPPPLTDSDRTILKELLEGCLSSLDHNNAAQVIRKQLHLPNHLTETQVTRIEEIAQSTDWALWCGQFKYWIGSGRWFRITPGVIW